MIIGTNHITFNQATMNKVVEYYLNTVLFKNNGTKVTSVTFRDNTFEIKFESVGKQDGDSERGT